MTVQEKLQNSATLRPEAITPGEFKTEHPEEKEETLSLPVVEVIDGMRNRDVPVTKQMAQHYHWSALKH